MQALPSSNRRNILSTEDLSQKAADRIVGKDNTKQILVTVYKCICLDSFLNWYSVAK